MSQKKPGEPFKHRCVQDLAWVIQSPPLISGNIKNVSWWGNDFFTNEYSDCLLSLKQLDTNPKPLLDALETAKSKRLGHYFEALVAYWLRLSPNYELILQNHQLTDRGKTLGEIDFLIRELASNKIIHLEVSVKFYLGTADLNDMVNWHGPGLQDRLDRKFNHLCEHQTQLSQKYPSLIPQPVDERACLIKGRLFYPPGTPPNTCFTSDGHLSGRWYDPPTIPDTDKTYWHLGKKNWLAAMNPENREPATALPDTLEEPALYAEHKHNKEVHRFFLLPENFWQRL